MNNIEYGNKLIRLGKLMKNDKTKLKDLVGAALDCGLIYTFGLTPNPQASVEMDLNKDNLCETCAKADKSCPIWPTSTMSCVEYIKSA